MRTIRTVICVAAILATGVLVTGGCNDDNSPSQPVATITSYDQVLGWDCSTGQSCQDVFDIAFAANTTVNLTAGETTGASVLQIALYAPGTALGGANLLTNDTRELRCNFVSGCTNNTAGQTVAGFVVATAGVYRLAVTRDWGSSCGGSGTYRLTIDADKGFVAPVQTVDDVPSAATDWGCPAEETSFDETFGWNCATSVSCQDVFDVTLTAGTTVSFEAKDTTGGSVLQIALYAPGTALGGTNLFTASTDELRCNYVSGCTNNTAGQTVSGFAVGTTGVYRLAVTRDWGSSCGGAGTYHLVITADQPIVVAQTVDDTATLASGWACP